MCYIVSVVEGARLNLEAGSAPGTVGSLNERQPGNRTQAPAKYDEGASGGAFSSQRSGYDVGQRS
jgi:hypothetical protein